MSQCRCGRVELRVPDHAPSMRNDHSRRLARGPAFRPSAKYPPPADTRNCKSRHRWKCENC